MVALSMSPIIPSYWDQLRQYLLRRGIDLNSERGQVVQTWLSEELHNDITTTSQEALAKATDTAVAIFDTFNVHFDELYMAEECPGERWVRKYMRARLGFVVDPMVEAVLGNIRDKRPRLLQAFRRKYQKSLFAAVSFLPQGVWGYLRRVAEVESLKAPLQESDRVTGCDWEALNRLPSPFHFEPDAEKETSDNPQVTELASQARRVAVFWTDPKNGFTRAQYLEGMTTLGLGWMTDDPILADRSRAHLADRIPSWSLAQQRLGDRVVRLLDQRGQLEAECFRLQDPRTNARLVDVQRRLNALQLRMSRHRNRLCPRPNEVATLLAGVVTQKVGGLRFQRIGRETEILNRRVQQGAVGLLTGRALSATRLIADVLDHAGAKPPSGGGHGLTEEERTNRRRAHQEWHSGGEEIISRVHRALRELFHDPAESSSGLLGWLYDVQDLYEFGILDRAGIVEGLKTRRGTRLNWLLR
jgi:hypothetical protein